MTAATAWSRTRLRQLFPRCRRRERGDPTTSHRGFATTGFLWLGVGPLVAGAVAELFGLKWQAMIQGSYTLAWRIGVAVGLAAGIIQVAFALGRPSEPPLLRTA